MIVQVSQSTEMNLRVLSVGMGWYPFDQGNGLDRVFYELYAHQGAAPLRVAPIVVSDTRQRFDGVSIVDAGSSLPRRLAGVRRAFEAAKHDADIAAGHFALYSLPIVRRLGDLPFVVHFHGPWADESRLEGGGAGQVVAKRLIERYVYNRAGRLIVLSSAFRRILAEDYGIPEQRVTVIPGGVDLDRFAGAPSRDEARRILQWPTDRPIVLSVRRLVRRVGLERLIDAAVRIRDHVPDVLLLIAGRGPLASELQTRIDDLGLNDTVSLLGFVPEEALPTAYAAADLSAIPSVGLEGFGLIAAESLAAGTPPVVTPVGGLPEVVQDLSSSLVTESATPESISDRIIALLLGRTKAPTREQCQAFARERYDWNEIVRQTATVYEEVVR